MKRVFIVMLVAYLLSISFSAHAKTYPNIPKPNTDQKIEFADFVWYSDYSETINSAINKGLPELGANENFKGGADNAAHWTRFYDSLFSNSNSHCGGYLHYKDIGEFPKIAGHSVYSISLFFMWDPEAASIPMNYKEKGASRFYMGIYSFYGDSQLIYDDFVKKLKTIYGKSPYQGHERLSWYCYWVNNENAVVGVCKNQSFVYLMYMAPNGEENLYKVEEMVTGEKPERIEDENMSGL